MKQIISDFWANILMDGISIFDIVFLTFCGLMLFIGIIAVVGSFYDDSDRGGYPYN